MFQAATARDLRQVLVPFPEHRILYARTRADQVAVTHRGETTVYACPEDLTAAVREHDPKVGEIDAAVGRARELVTLAEQREAEARALRLQAEADCRDAHAALVDAVRIRSRARAYVRKLWIAALVGAALGVVAFGAGL